MPPLQHLLSITSTLFRLFCYTFLRIIPVSIGKILIPTLYALYASLYAFDSSESPEIPKREKSLVDVESSPRKWNATCISTYVRDACTMLFSLPTYSLRLRNASFVINTTLLLFCIDFMSAPLRSPAVDTVFARVGAIDHQSAKVVIRYPQPGINLTSVQLVHRVVSNDNEARQKWTIGPQIELSSLSDWVNTTLITNLWPSTDYEFRLAHIDRSLEFMPYPPAPLKFKTFPDPRLQTGSHFRFITTSCILPNFPYSPGHGSRIKGFDLLFTYLWGRSNSKSNDISEPTNSSYIQNSTSLSSSGDIDTTSNKPSAAFMLLLGDFIYSDVPVYFGEALESYLRLYRRNYASPSFRKVYERLPIFHIYDDHEIINNFVGQSNDSVYPYPNASKAFDIYNAQANFNPIDAGTYYFQFRYGDSVFFVLDTRRYRSAADSNTGTSTMLGDLQLLALQTWLSEVNQTATFKFIVSSVPFTSLWQFDAQADSWAAYPEEKALLLRQFQSVPNVIILSGDRHEFAAIEFNGPESWSHTVLEISCSPFSMFSIPMIRTLKMASDAHVERRRLHVTNIEGVETATLQSELVPEEKVLRYIPDGNHKWSSIEIDSRNWSTPRLELDVVVDGRSAYLLNYTGTPIKLKRSTALGVSVSQSFRGVLDKIGLAPGRWF